MRELRDQPRSRLPHPSLARIAGYVGGYIMARASTGITGENDLLLDFDEWLRLLFGVRWTGNAESVITLFADDGAHAVKMYFHLFDDFMAWRVTRDAQSVTPLRGRFPSTDKWLRRHNLDSLINELRQRPGIYVGQPMLSRVTAYLRGFVGAEHDMGMKRDKELFDDFD
ncbi:MAG: hypothetical protein ACREHD_26900, partial [Pirellulales bacterium]